MKVQDIRPGKPWTNSSVYGMGFHILRQVRSSPPFSVLESNTPTNLIDRMVPQSLPDREKPLLYSSRIHHPEVLGFTTVSRNRRPDTDPESISSSTVSRTMSRTWTPRYRNCLGLYIICPFCVVIVTNIIIKIFV